MPETKRFTIRLSELHRKLIETYRKKGRGRDTTITSTRWIKDAIVEKAEKESQIKRTYIKKEDEYDSFESILKPDRRNKK